MFALASLLLLSAHLQAKLVSFRFLPTQPAQSVALVGSFNNWDKARNPMHLDTDGKTWIGEMMIEPGVYQYKFCQNGSLWLQDPSAPPSPDLNGNVNSELVVTPSYFEKHQLGQDFTPEAFAHTPSRVDLTRVGKGTATTDLRTRRQDASKVFVVVERKSFPMHVQSSDGLFDYWRGNFNISESGPTNYYFRIQNQTEVTTFPEGGNATQPPRSPFSAAINQYPLPNPPGWVKDAIFYQIFPERFENGDPTNDGPGVQPWGSKPTYSNRMGGDLKGITRHMPYLKSLGINALYLNPIFTSGSNHGYDTYDYLHVDPRFGTNDNLKVLVRQAHKSGIRVILDGVFNHSGTHFFAFEDLVKNQQKSKYASWYHVLRYPVEAKSGQQSYGTFGGVWQMPKWNQADPGARAYLLNVATYWIKYADIDGWRLDVADEVPHDYWVDFRKAVRAAKPDAYILGEEWHQAHRWLQGDEHDAAMNYPWRGATLSYFNRRITGPQFVEALTAIRDECPPDALTSQFDLLGSHDTTRVLRELKGDKKALFAAITFQFFYPGVPTIYYGDEIGMDGGADPDDRRCMIWDSSKWDKDTVSLYSSLIAMRKAYPELRSGALEMSATADGLTVTRKLAGHASKLVISNSFDTAITRS